MRVVVADFESKDQHEYNFFGCTLNEISHEPFHLRHEYYEREKNVKQSLHLFGKRPDERGTQIFIEKYFDYANNSKFDESLQLYKNQESNFKLLNNIKVSKTLLLNEIEGEKSCHQFMTKDGRYRRRIVHDIRGDKNALLIVFSIDTTLFVDNQLFYFIKNHFNGIIE
jgi:hypothetical protein